MSLERPQIEKPEGDIPFDLGIEDLTAGEGDEATKGKKVSVHYVGVAFSNGEEFDASWNRGQPFEFKLGKGQVIPGWDAGVQGMKVGGRRKLTIPSAMAYGARGAGRRDQAARAAGVRGRSTVRELTRRSSALAPEAIPVPVEAVVGYEASQFAGGGGAGTGGRIGRTSCGRSWPS